jgi:hypothetical protein
MCHVKNYLAAGKVSRIKFIEYVTLRFYRGGDADGVGEARVFGTAFRRLAKTN